jgi:hypothetical protein
MLGAAIALTAAPARADGTFLETVHRHVTLGSTVADNGDQNPYALFIAPVSAGKINQGDILVTNFNNTANLQGTGSTIVAISPETKALQTVAAIPRTLPGCPGGIGLSTALVMLKSGWLIVGSAPSTDGTTRTRGDGCLLVLDANGHVAAAWSGADIVDPWGNMAVIDNGNSATLFVSMAGLDVPAPSVKDPATGLPVIVNKATVVRLQMTIPQGKPPVVTSRTVIASGFGQRADKDAFMIGPTGNTLGADGTLYVSDALANRVVAIDHAATRTDSAGLGRTVTSGGFLQHPLAMITAPNGHLLVVNGKNGQVVEIDPASGQQLAAQWIDANAAQQPPGNGDLFGIVIAPDGKSFYYVEDEMNTVVQAK